MNIADFLEQRLGGELGSRLERQARKLSPAEVRRLVEEWIEVEYRLPLPAPAGRQTIVSGLCDRVEVDGSVVSKVASHWATVDWFHVYPPSDFFRTVVTYTEGANLRYVRKLLLAYDRILLPFNGKLIQDLESMYRLDGYWLSLLVARLRILKPFLDRGLIHLCPVNNGAALEAHPREKLWKLLEPISHDEYDWRTPGMRFMSDHYVEAISWAYQFEGFLSTNHTGLRDTIHQVLSFLELEAEKHTNLTAVSPFSLLLHSIDMPAIERLKPEDQAAFAEQIFHYQKFRSLVDRFCEQMAAFPQGADPGALVTYGRECAQDTFQPAVQGVLPKSIPELLKDSATNITLSFLGLQALHGVPVDLEKAQQTLLEAAVPTLMLLLKDLSQASRQQARHRLFLNHCGLFLNSKFDRLSVDVIPTAVGAGR